MSIEFACPTCDSFLRTADEKAGLRIRCPACQEPAWVPYLDQHHFHQGYGDRQDQETSSFQSATSEKWDAAPAHSTGTAVDGDRDGHLIPEHATFLAGSEQTEQLVTLSGILQQTWEVYTTHFGKCLLASIMDLLATIVGCLVALLMGGFTLLILQGQQEFAVLAAVGVWMLGMVVTYSAISVGNFRYYLALARGAPLQPRGVMVREAAVGQLIVAWIFFWVVAFLGLLMFVIPGLLAMIVMWPFAAIIVDRNVSAPRAFYAALSMTRRRPDISTRIFILHLLLLLAGTLPVLGQFVAMPLAAVFHSVSYLHLSGDAAAKFPVSIPKFDD